MKGRPLWRVSVSATLEGEDAVAELLSQVFKRSPALYTNEKTKVSQVSVYCQKRSEWTEKRRAALVGGLKEIQRAGLRIGSGKITAAKVPREDWSESWKRHFKPIEIGSRLLIKPSWAKRRSKKGQAVVVLDPGLSFGTGNHPTTAFCLRQLAACRKPGQPQAVLDMGTGSGILAIAAVKLGYAPVKAFDFDPEAVRVARQNARLNRVSKRLSITRQDITKLSLRNHEKFDVICANLISNLLLAEMNRIVARLPDGGMLLLAGILRKEFAQIQGACERAGLRLVQSHAEGEWRSGAFAFVTD
jgi:ribosomal protein L11 methyltransferase